MFALLAWKHITTSFYICAKWSGGKDGINRTLFKAFLGRQLNLQTACFMKKKESLCEIYNIKKGMFQLCTSSFLMFLQIKPSLSPLPLWCTFSRPGLFVVVEDMVLGIFWGAGCTNVSSSISCLHPWQCRRLLEKLVKLCPSPHIPRKLLFDGNTIFITRCGMSNVYSGDILRFEDFFYFFFF